MPFFNQLNKYQIINFISILCVAVLLVSCNNGSLTNNTSSFTKSSSVMTTDNNASSLIMGVANESLVTSDIKITNPTQHNNIPIDSKFTIEFPEDVDQDSVMQTSPESMGTITLYELNNDANQLEAIQLTSTYKQTDVRQWKLITALFIWKSFNTLELSLPQPLTLDPKHMYKIVINGVSNIYGQPEDNLTQYYVTQPAEVIIATPKNLDNVATESLALVIEYPYQLNKSLIQANTIQIKEKSSGNLISSITKLPDNGSNTVTITTAQVRLLPDTDYNIMGNIYDTNGILHPIAKAFHTVNPTQQPIMTEPNPTTNASLDTNVVFDLPSDIDMASITESSIMVKGSNGKLVSGNISATQKRVTFAPMTTIGYGYNPGETYRATVNVRDVSGIPMVGNGEFTTVIRESTEQLIIYEATNDGQGYLGSLGGVAGADALCNIDHDKPTKPAYYKAILGSPGRDPENSAINGRYPCKYSARNGSVDCSRSGHKDWPLYANMPYYNVATQPVLIGTTNESGFFNNNPQFTTTIRVRQLPNAFRAWTGLRITIRLLNFERMTTLWQSGAYNETCNGWLDGTNNVAGRIGAPSMYRPMDVFDLETGRPTYSCDFRYTIYCAQQ